jgi:RND family efflux transporter MFP subunit
MTRALPFALLAAALGLAGCAEERSAEPAAHRPVATVVIEPAKVSDAARFSGDIQAEKEVAHAFRIGGRLLERPVNVGDTVSEGQVIARLEDQTERSTVVAAEAAVYAARGEVSKRETDFDRQSQLMAQGFTTRPRYDEARQRLVTAQAAYEDAKAQLESARDRLGFTELRATVSGTVTARGAEPGEVVQAGQSVVSVARGDGRDAVFNIAARFIEAAASEIVVDVTLVSDPTVSVQGRVREIAPQADPQTGTFRVRVGLDNAPATMVLGAPVTGSVTLETEAAIVIPASALTMLDRDPAVWVIDPGTGAVQKRAVDVVRFEPRTVVLSGGVAPGERIVTGGIQALHPGQRVRVLEPPSP